MSYCKNCDTEWGDQSLLSPLKRHYQKLTCDECKKNINDAVLLSIGLGWNGGWKTFCNSCYHEVNFWEEDHDQRMKHERLYSVKACT